MTRNEDDLSVLMDQLDRPKRTVDQVAADIAIALRAGPSPRLCKALAEMIDPKGRPVVTWRLKLQRHKQGRPKGDARIGMEMATLVDDQRVPVKEAVSLVQEKFGAKGNSRSTLLDALRDERQWRELAEFFDDARKLGPK